jgi:magnesium-transporting ATPase (P-type)
MTPLQERLDKIRIQISWRAYLNSVVLAVVLLIYWVILSFGKDIEFLSNENMMKFVNHGMTAVAILIVSVPEGLPLAVSIASVFSYDRLMK